MAVTVYGIPNCDSVKKAISNLKAGGEAFSFHDVRKDGLTEDLLRSWLKQVQPDILINRKGSTWRQLPDDQRARAEDLQQLVALLMNQPTLIKRPVIDRDGIITVGQTAF